MSLRRSIALFLGAGIAALGCGQPDSDSPYAMAPNPSPGAMYIVHAVPDAPALDIYIDDQPAVSGLAYRKSSGSVSAAAGPHQIDLRPAGASPMEAPLYTNHILVEAEKKVLVAAIGRLGDHADAKKLSIVAEPFGTPRAAEVHLRLLPASPSAPALDLQTDAHTLIESAGFGTLTPTAVLAKNGDIAGPLSLALAQAGEKSSLAAVALPGPYKAGAVLDVIVLGETHPLAGTKFLGAALFNETSGELSDLSLTINSQGKAPSFYLYHGSADAPAVDFVSKDNAMMAKGLAYKQASPLFTPPAGTHPVEVRQAGTDQVLAKADLQLLPGMRFTLYTAGLQKNPMPGQGFSLYAAPRSEKGTSTRWRIVNAVYDAPALELKNNDQKLFADVAYPSATPYRQEDLGAATLKLGISDDMHKGWDLVIPPMLGNGEVMTIFLTGSVGNAGQPLAAVAAKESTAAMGQAPELIPLLISAAPLR